MYLQIIMLSHNSVQDMNSACMHNLQEARRPNQKLQQKAWPRLELPPAVQLQLWHNYISSNFLRYSKKRKQALGPSILKPTLLTDNAFHHPKLQQDIKPLPLWHSHLLYDHQQMSADIEVWQAFKSWKWLTIVSKRILWDEAGTFG